jgi:hypothetical protein
MLCIFATENNQREDEIMKNYKKKAAIDPEDIAAMDMPCMCDCGEWFDLNEGNTCDGCNKVFCTECVDEPFGLCPQCQYSHP